MKLRGERALLKLDIDAGAERPTVETLTARVRTAGYRIVWLWERRSPSGNGWHIVLKLRPTPATPQTVVALQALLGSDPFREARNLRRANQFADVPPFMRDRWNVLYKPGVISCLKPT